MKTHTLLLTIAVAFAATACHKSADSDAHGAMPTPTVDVALPVIDSVTLHRTFPAYLSAAQSADVVARVSGTVLTKPYASGTYVERGQVLFTIESEQYRDALMQAEAQLATAKSQLEYYTKQHDATQRALASGAVAQIEADQVESNLHQAEAAVKSAQAAIATARLNLDYCTVRAPISGHITDSPIDVGAYVAGGVQPVTLCTVYADKELEVVFQIESAQYQALAGAAGGLSAPQYRAVPVTFQSPTQGDYTADLYYTDPAVDHQTGTVTLRGRLSNPLGELKDGMYATVSLPYGTDAHAMLIRDASIGTDQLGKYVYVVDDSCRVVYTPIRTGDTYNDSLRIVESGLRPTDRYVTSALLTVRNGQKVHPVTVK